MPLDDTNQGRGDEPSNLSKCIAFAAPPYIYDSPVMEHYTTQIGRLMGMKTLPIMCIRSGVNNNYVAGTIVPEALMILNQVRALFYVPYPDGRFGQLIHDLIHVADVVDCPVYAINSSCMGLGIEDTEEERKRNEDGAELMRKAQEMADKGLNDNLSLDDILKKYMGPE